MAVLERYLRVGPSVDEPEYSSEAAGQAEMLDPREEAGRGDEAFESTPYDRRWLPKPEAMDREAESSMLRRRTLPA